MTVRSITSLSLDDIKWVHKTAMADFAKGPLTALSLEQLATWRTMCIIAALNALIRMKERE